MTPPVDRWIEAAEAGAAELRAMPGLSERAIRFAADRIESAMARYAHNIVRSRKSDLVAEAYGSVSAKIRAAIGAAEEELSEDLAGPHDGYCAVKQSPEDHQRDHEQWQSDLETTIRCLRRLSEYHEKSAAYWSTPAMRPRSSDNPALKDFVNLLVDIYCEAREIDRKDVTLSASDGPRCYAMNFLVAVLAKTREHWEPDRRTIMRWVDR